MRFEFATAARIVFGPGCLKQLPALVAGWGPHALVVTGRQTDRARGPLELLEKAGLETSVFPVSGEPSVATVSAGVEMARTQGAQFVVGFGGGSAIDAAKAIAGLLTNPGDPLDYLEVVGRGTPLAYPAAPWIAIPTTSGTGAEVTRNAVLTVPEHRVKVSLRSPHLLARIALVDPELTLGLPADVTATTGLDALTQLIEARVSAKANPLTSALCDSALPLGVKALRRLQLAPDDLRARTDLAYASLCSGLALANAGLGVVHGFAAVLGGMYPIAHGAACAALLAPVVRANIAAFATRAPQHPAAAGYQEIARAVTGDVRAEGLQGAESLSQLVNALRVPTLRQAGVGMEEEGAILEKVQRASSTQGNPIVLTLEELRLIFREAM